MLGYIFHTDKSAMGLQFKNEYVSRAVVLLVNLFNCTSIWLDERLSHMTPTNMLQDDTVSPKIRERKKKKKRYSKLQISIRLMANRDVTF
jgi:hypothetical protein